MVTQRQFGPIPDVLVGRVFDNRLELSVARVHRPPQAGISGSRQDGSDSIVLNGGYADDEDHGDVSSIPVMVAKTAVAGKSETKK